jgi:hypothetical protein
MRGPGLKERSVRLAVFPLVAFIGIIVAWALVAHMRGGSASVVQDGGEGAMPVVTSGPGFQSDPALTDGEAPSEGRLPAGGGGSGDMGPDGEGAGDEDSDDAHAGEMPSGSENTDNERCPIDLGEARFVSAKRNSAGNAWRYRSDETMVALAERMLGQLERDGWMLVDASQADLLGEAWNCVAMNASDSRVLLITITPEIWGGVRDGDASSLVSIVRLAE